MALSAVLGGRPSTSAHGPDSTALDKHYVAFVFRVTAGHWRLYSAKNKQSSKEATVLLFDKRLNVKAPAKIGRVNRPSLVDLLRHEATQLLTLAHPRILQALHGIEENKDTLVFACECLAGTLATLYAEGQHQKVAPFEAVEIKCGILQLSDALSFLHDTARILHGNVCPDAVYVTGHGLWKLGGFTYAVDAKGTDGYPCHPWTKKLPAAMQPDLDFMAPEYFVAGQKTITSAADVFSLGVLVCWIHGGGRPIIDAKQSVEAHAIICGQLADAVQLMGGDLGASLKDAILKVLSVKVDQRPSAQFLAMIKHFDDPAVSCLRQLDDLAQQTDPMQKAQFLCTTLRETLYLIPEHLWVSRVLPRLTEELQDVHELYSSVIKPLLYMLEHCESHNIDKFRPWISRIVKHCTLNHVMLVSYVLENMVVIYKRLSDQIIEDKLLELTIASLNCSLPQLQSSALVGLPHVRQFLPAGFLQASLFPGLEKCLRCSMDAKRLQLVAVNCLLQMADKYDAGCITPLLRLTALTNMTEPDVAVAVSKVFKRLLADHKRLGVNEDLVTGEILPQLVHTLTNKELSPAQFDQLMSTCRIMLDFIEDRQYEHFRKTSVDCVTTPLRSHRFSVSGGHLPQVLITSSAGSPSLGGRYSDERKMSFLSADGRLEDHRISSSRRSSKDSRSSVDSFSDGGVNMDYVNTTNSLRMASVLFENQHRAPSSSTDDDEGASRAMRHNARQQVRRKSWLEGYFQSVTDEQSFSDGPRPFHKDINSRKISQQRHRQSASIPPSFTRLSPTSRRRHSMVPPTAAEGPNPVRPNSFTNLGHNLACTIWKTFY
uniref:Protein kinase domain-containing protein n=1 Tax=Plectus sambesii TaxID=2011161 RepID=A0A914VPV1_9BILA